MSWYAGSMCMGRAQSAGRAGGRLGCGSRGLDCPRYLRGKCGSRGWERRGLSRRCAVATTAWPSAEAPLGTVRVRGPRSCSLVLWVLRMAQPTPPSCCGYVRACCMLVYWWCVGGGLRGRSRSGGSDCVCVPQKCSRPRVCVRAVGSRGLRHRRRGPWALLGGSLACICWRPANPTPCNLHVYLLSLLWLAAAGRGLVCDRLSSSMDDYFFALAVCTSDA